MHEHKSATTESRDWWLNIDGGVMHVTCGPFNWLFFRFDGDARMSHILCCS